MLNSQRMRVFVDKYPLVGPALWILSVQYFVIQLIVANHWRVPYSLLNNTISDLGNTACAIYGGRDVCSPLNPLMNASFVILGLTMFEGAMLIYQEFRKNTGSAMGFTFMALAGLGTILVGIFPENTISPLHFLGAMLPFLIGNIGMIILGLSLKLPKWLRVYSVTSGIISLVALGFFITHSYLGLGIGGMERIVAYPQTIWLIVFGIYISKSR
jgi:hypothetical membrane protein